MLEGKKILVAVTGSIAIYKTLSLIRLLTKAGAEVKVIMTDAATKFVTALSFSTISKNEVLSEISTETKWANHVLLGRWADLMLIAPLSCNTLSKMANGVCDNLLTAVYLSATCKVAVAPAMDEDMWLHPATKQNIDKIISYGNYVLHVNKGELASGLIGDGRMAEPEEIFEWINIYFTSKKDLLNKKILISAGPTQEPIDPVRFLGNRSTGKMGIAIAKECVSRGANVSMVLGPTTEEIPNGINVVRANTAIEMYDVCNEIFKDVDIAIMCAAVADYTPVKVEADKIKKNGATLNLELTKTKDILKSLGAKKNIAQTLVGFALETENEKQNAIGKLRDKNADFIVLNSLNDKNAGFGYNTNKITIFDKHGKEFEFENKNKNMVAKDIIDTIIKYPNA